MDLASRARAPVWALLGAFGPASVLDVNVGQSFFSAAPCSAVPGAVVVLRAGAAGVMAAMAAGVGGFNLEGLLAGELVLPLKGEKRCGESAAGFWAMQVINTANLPLFESVGGCAMGLYSSPGKFATGPCTASGDSQRNFARVLEAAVGVVRTWGTPKKTGLF